MPIHLVQRGKEKTNLIKPSIADIRAVESLKIQKGPKRKNLNLDAIVVYKPWGREYLCGRNKYFEVWQLFMNPGSATSLHCHPDKDTLNLILEGEIILETFRGKAALNAGNFRIIKGGTIHRMINPSRKVVRVLEIESPPQKSNLIRVKDNYGRESRAYISTKIEKSKKGDQDVCLKRSGDFDQVDSYFKIRSFIKHSFKSKQVFELHLSNLSFDREKLELVRTLGARNVSTALVERIGSAYERGFYA